ncbi:DUF58 domain-containing protein [Nocardioides sp. GY 10127]|uniref:DUF58 domain-containing protein n=1 Tax=Nocardioides sp. GY 10127 TaxID=2569762 RepID=UPI0010A8CB3E|nr:DUF58 domain-containing protein [Nocardioides sp. GY 10127]TIC78935.1 DUF58 domain-containing protein [Nocardioides sp. GY 10127]
MGHVQRVRTHLSLPAHRPVRGLLEGEYASAVTGRGPELADLREYVPGDDVGDLDWKASARSGQLLVRRYVAQRRHTVLLAVATGADLDAHAGVSASPLVSGSGAGRPVTRREVAVLAAGTVGWLAVQHADAVGAVWGDADGFHQLPPRTGELHLERCLAGVHEASSGRTDTLGLLAHLVRTVRRRTLLVLVIDAPAEEPAGAGALVAPLRRLVAQHEVLVLSVGDAAPTGVAARAPRVAAPAAAGRARRLLPRWVSLDDRLARDEADADRARVATLAAACAEAGAAHAHLDDVDAVARGVLSVVERRRRARR